MPDLDARPSIGIMQLTPGARLLDSLVWDTADPLSNLVRLFQRKKDAILSFEQVLVLFIQHQGHAHDTIFPILYKLEAH